MFPLYGVALTESMFHTLNAVIVPATSHVYGRLRTLVQWSAVTSARHSSQNNGRAYPYMHSGSVELQTNRSKTKVMASAVARVAMVRRLVRRDAGCCCSMAARVAGCGAGVCWCSWHSFRLMDQWNYRHGKLSKKR